MRITQYRDMRPLMVDIHTAGSAGAVHTYLDAEDYHFIEQVRLRGKLDVAGATLSEMWTPHRESIEDQNGSWRYAEARCREADRSHSSFFDEEMLEYWEKRWAFEDNLAAERRAVMAEQEVERRRLLRQRALDRATAEGELAREELAWQAEQEKLAREREKRLKDTMQADIEWENAKLIQQDDHDDEGYDGKHAEWWKDIQAADRVRDAPFSEQRHYVPIWDWVEREEERKREREERAARKVEEAEAKRLRAQEIVEENERRQLKEVVLSQEQAVELAVQEGRKRALAEAWVKRENERHEAEKQYRAARLEEARWLGEHGRYVPLRPNKT